MKLFLLSIVCSQLILNTYGQTTGLNDPTFNTNDVGFGKGDGSNDPVYKIVRLSSGKYLMCGGYNYYNSLYHSSMIRLNADGTYDNSFNTFLNSGASVKSFDLQSDGKIIMVGTSFSSGMATINSKIVRLNNDGSIDNSFNVGGLGPNNTIMKVLVQADDKLLIYGNFTSFNGIAVNKFMRLNPDGQPDITFNSGTFVGNGVVEDIEMQNDGKIYVAGTFTSYNGNAVHNYVRINSDGSIDSGFNHTHSPNNAIKSINILSNGNVLFAGYFDMVSSVNRNKIFRVDSNGNIDLTFNAGTSSNGFIKNSFVQPDNKILISGQFTNFNGITNNRIARLNENGSVDNTFDAGEGLYYYNDEINSVIFHSDGTILIAGSFDRYDSHVKNEITLINDNGSVNDNFNKGNGVVNSGWPNGTNLYTIAVQDDNKMYIGGRFRSYNSINRDYIARLNSDGALDTAFVVGSGFEGPFSSCSVRTIAIQSDGKVLVGGRFFDYNGDTLNNIVRLNPDGSIDNNFMIGFGSNAPIKQIKIQSDDKIIVMGDFTNFNNTSTNFIVRLNPDGTFDNTFNVGTGANGGLWCFKVQADGKIIIGGNFSNFNGVVANKVVRLNPDGSIDNTFDVGLGPNSKINTIETQNDNKILIGGGFTDFNGTSINRLVRLNPDGAIDNSFNIGAGAADSVNSIIIDDNGQILIAGKFYLFNGINVGCIIRLNTDGSIDTNFDATTGTGINGEIKTMSKQDYGRIIIGGYFTSYKNTGRNRIARIYNCEAPVTSLPPFGEICDTATVLQLNQGTPSGGFYSLNGNIISSFDPATSNLGDNTITYTLVQNACGGQSSNIIIVVACEENNIVELSNLISIFPSPTNGIIKISGISENELIAIELYNSLGKLITSYKMSQIDLSSYPNGIYHLKVIGKVNERMLKVILEK